MSDQSKLLIKDDSIFSIKFYTLDQVINFREFVRGVIYHIKSDAPSKEEWEQVNSMLAETTTYLLSLDICPVCYNNIVDDKCKCGFDKNEKWFDGVNNNYEYINEGE